MENNEDFDYALQGSIQVYLESLPKTVLDRLYKQPATSLAILRLLPQLAKHVVMRLLYTQGSLGISSIKDWMAAHAETYLDPVMKQLEKLHIVTRNTSGMIMVNSILKESLHQAFSGGGEHTSFGAPSLTRDKQPVDIAFLDQYAQESWDAVLHFLVGTPSSKKPKAMVKLLERSGLMALPSGNASAHSSLDDLRITSKGFQFLLQPLNVQIWFFLLQYIELAEELNMELVEVLNFLFQLGSLELGQDYSVEALTPTQKHMLDDLKCLGLVYQRKRKSTRFYPTRLATTLASGSANIAREMERQNNTIQSASGQDSISGLPSSLSMSGFIIVETNYRVYMYTSSPLQIAILSLFIAMRARFANMVVGMLTRESVREAFSNGISADQIISYLTTHAHPEMKRSTPILPSTVVDQIRLWEMERNRLRVSKGHLYKDFATNREYQEVLNFAKSFHYDLWHSDAKRMLVMTVEGHEAFRQYREKIKAAAMAAAANGRNGNS